MIFMQEKKPTVLASEAKQGELYLQSESTDTLLMALTAEDIRIEQRGMIPFAVVATATHARSNSVGNMCYLAATTSIIKRDCSDGIQLNPMK